jgi:IS30 family transposase
MSHTQLNLKQRFQLETLLGAGWMQKNIAHHIDVNPSTVSRGVYDARSAHSRSSKRRKSGKRKTKVLLKNETVKNYVEKKLKKDWSPEQIAGRGKTECPGMVCHETIYQFIYAEETGWKIYFRQKKGKYRRRHGTKVREKKREDAKKQRVDTRSEVIEKRERIGDWEGDTIVGGEKTTGILTHVERKSGYLIANLFLKKNAVLIKEKTIESFLRISSDKKYSITYDNGVEFSEHELTGRKTKMTIYFAYPYHSWERGTNENTNGLLRQYFPKKMMLAKLTQKDVDAAVGSINNRPRKRLNYLTPYEVFVEGRIAIQARM